MTHYQGSDDERRALDVYIKLMRASDTVALLMKRSLAEQGLTMSQLGILEALLHLGPLNPTQLAAKILRSSGNITTVVDNLEKRGLVRRERSQEDRRMVEVHLTEDGQRCIGGYFPDHVRTIEELMDPLSPNEQQALAALCRKLGTALAEQV